jgi:DNA-binding LacI/PurR family transcriptional regulator
MVGEQGRTRAQAATRLLSRHRRPTGIVCASDSRALGALEARDLGLGVPTDVSVVGYDDLEFAGYLG